MDNEEKNSYQDVLQEARERYEKISEDDKDNRDNQLSDTKFVYSPGEQWSAEVRQKRERWKESCLEFNQLKQFVNQVVGDQRQSKPAIIVSPADGEASVEVADILKGMTRAIEYESKAESIYDSAFHNAVVGGRGWWRITTEYDGEGFNQKIKISPILDPLTVYADNDYEQADGADRKYVFVTQNIKKSDFEATYPEAKPLSWNVSGNNWYSSDDEVVIADYYRRVLKKRTMVLMSDGASGWEDGMPSPPPGITVVKKRSVDTYKIEWYKIAGGEQTLEKYDLPGEFIPVVMSAGHDVIIEGKRIYQGLIRGAKDAQAMFNYGMTQQAIHLSLTPKAPWVAPQEAVEDYQEIWKNANVENYSLLPYKHKDDAGNPIPAPTRTAPSLPDAGWIKWCDTMTSVMRSTIGMYENSLGMRGTETSGRAILAREKQGDTGTFNFVDNLHRAIALTGKIIVSWIPTYYDTERIVYTVGQDGVRKAVKINQSSPNPNNPLEAIRMNDVTVGKYSVSIEAGAGYATKRQETSQKLMEFVQAFPPAAAVAGDLIIRSLDIDDANIIAERLKATLPPHIQKMEAEKAMHGKAIDPVSIMRIQELTGQMEQMKADLTEMQQKNQELEMDAQSEMGKLRVKEVVAAKELELKKISQIEEIKLQRERALAELNIKKEMINREAELEVHKIQVESEVKLKIASREAEFNESRKTAEINSKPETQPVAQQPQEIHVHLGGKRVITLPDGRTATVQDVSENASVN